MQLIIGQSLLVLCAYFTYIKLISRGSQYVSTKYKTKEIYRQRISKTGFRFVTPFEGEYRIIIKQREHLKHCFVLILF